MWRGIGIAAYKRIKKLAEHSLCRTFDIFSSSGDRHRTNWSLAGKEQLKVNRLKVLILHWSVFGNEIKRKREEYLIKVSDD